jgi:HEAT repeat protein
LSRFHNSASEITPFLTQNLFHPNASLRAFTAGVLGSFGSPASNSVPALLEACRDGQTGVSEAAQDALKKIDPIAATKAGIK